MEDFVWIVVRRTSSAVTCATPARSVLLAQRIRSHVERATFARERRLCQHRALSADSPTRARLAAQRRVSVVLRENFATHRDYQCPLDPVIQVSIVPAETTVDPPRDMCARRGAIARWGHRPPHCAHLAGTTTEVALILKLRARRATLGSIAQASAMRFRPAHVVPATFAPEAPHLPPRRRHPPAIGAHLVRLSPWPVR